jgi:hypothetical protein
MTDIQDRAVATAIDALELDLELDAVAEDVHLTTTAPVLPARGGGPPAPPPPPPQPSGDAPS